MHSGNPLTLISRRQTKSSHTMQNVQKKKKQKQQLLNFYYYRHKFFNNITLTFSIIADRRQLDRQTDEETTIQTDIAFQAHLTEMVKMEQPRLPLETGYEEGFVFA